MPRGRKRKVLLEASVGEEAMDVEAALANEVGAENVENEEEKQEEPKNDEPGEETDEANDEADLAPPLDNNDVPQAQVEVSTMDVLTCGKCHENFHFVEQFLNHKKGECTEVSTLFTGNTRPDSKPQVCAFVLYKMHKAREAQNEGKPASNSWEYYQKWTQLNDRAKQTWISNAKSVQELASFAPATTPIKVISRGRPKTILTPLEREQQQQTLLELQKELEDDTETQVMSTLGLVRGKGQDEDRPARAGLNQIWRKSLKPDADDDEMELYTVEKIVAKRTNPKTKQPEYLVKWVGHQSDQNTWEHIQNMATCMKMIAEFEKNLARQKARKAAAEASKMKNVVRLDEIVTTPGGRPVRNSALKALDQVKEWVGQRNLDSDEASEGDEPPNKRSNLDLVLKKKFGQTGKSPVILANSRGVVRVDPKQLNLSSGVYILSSKSGMMKMDDSFTSKLTSCLNTDKKIINQDRVMINETEVRKIPASQVTPKIGILRKEMTPIKKDSPSQGVNIVRQRVTTVRPAGPGRPATNKIILGSPRVTKPLPGPVPSPLRPPPPKTRVITKTVGRPPKQKGLLLSRLEKKVVNTVEEDFDGNLTEELQKDQDTSNLTLCPLTGEVMENVEGEKADDDSLAEVDEDGMMRVAVSPGGSIHHVVHSRTQQRGKQMRSLLTARTSEAEAEQQPEEEQELISIQGEDGQIYQITPEQQQLLLQNGSLTMDKPEDENYAQQTEFMVENGQLLERRVVGIAESEGGQEEEQTMLVQGVKEEAREGEAYEEAGLTLENAVQEAVSQAEQAEVKVEEGQQMVAQIVQAEPPTPGGGPRKVVLLLPDGSLLETEMEEEQYQALDFEK